MEKIFREKVDKNQTDKGRKYRICISFPLQWENERSSGNFCAIFTLIIFIFNLRKVGSVSICWWKQNKRKAPGSVTMTSYRCDPPSAGPAARDGMLVSSETSLHQKLCVRVGSVVQVHEFYRSSTDIVCKKTTLGRVKVTHEYFLTDLILNIPLI